MEYDKYSALREDKEIAINLLSAIFRKRKDPKKITEEEENYIEKEVLRMRALGINNKKIREKLGISQYRIVKVLKEHLIYQ